MKKKIYLIKSLAPWMMDELIAFSNRTNFTIVFLRKQSDFYYEGINKLHDNKIIILTMPFKSNYIFRKLIFMISFSIKNINKFFGGYNSAIGLKSLYWFMRLDLSIFNETVSIHAQFATQAAIISLMIKEYFKKDIEYTFTFHAHDIYFDNKWFTTLINYSEKAFSISEYNINYVKSAYKNLIEKKIILSRLGVFKPLLYKSDDNKKGNVLTIGLISWFIEKKGIKYLLEAMKKLKNKNIQLILAGDGPLKNEILEFIEVHELKEYFNYIGIIKGKKKIDFFMSLDAFILPAITVPNDMDGIPVVLMEAISFGLPIISTDVSGIPEICINNYNGFLINEKNSSQIIKAIINLKNDRKLRYTFSLNSKRLSSQYNIEINSKNKLTSLGWD